MKKKFEDWSIFEYVAMDTKNEVYASGPNRAIAETAAIAAGVPSPCIMPSSMYVHSYRGKK